MNARIAPREEILEEALQLLIGGMPLEEVLVKYACIAVELAPLLKTALLLQRAAHRHRPLVPPADATPGDGSGRQS